MDLNGMNPSMLWTTVITVMALVIAAVSILTLVKLIRELRGPKMSEARSIENKLARDNERLEDLEASVKKQDAELKLILRSQKAMLHHMIDGNGIEKLKQVQSDIDEYLIYGRNGGGGSNVN